MRQLRVVTALVCLVAASLAEAAAGRAADGHLHGAPRALLSGSAADGGVLVVPADPSPAPSRDAKLLVVLVPPTAAPSAGVSQAAIERSAVVRRLEASAHRQRGPPPGV
ncbi:MAG: hypothetical protein DWQ36_19565 [Acidobacteria bacterium]|nr:MAG: hypothetical protein DWQ30_06075 [Acidobacteriota bacterium]REK03739.1 MAG: hypothetical protein DWQ36_19565 [Acidobacteriota bacterium]